MKKILLCLLLTGCVNPQQQYAANEQYKQEMCASVGITPGTPRYSSCMLTVQSMLNENQAKINAQNHYNDEMLRQQTFQNQYNMIDSVRPVRGGVYGRY